MYLKFLGSFDGDARVVVNEGRKTGLCSVRGALPTTNHNVWPKVLVNSSLW